ncbi:MarC family integral membrane protein [Candidatus Bilamarchaeum dharawalense]|uniref:UPF0056 membrane protein n=1 Tax=Candidatus Bilamarchaeum dharawalense TaxID=2885759 RepID=A0A5E4LTD1_9ARCH|nr:MarC family integral membrane protein [Candidatus Bilamarchaeum dharawalense]
MDLPSAIVTCFITIFAIMDPFASLPPFLMFTKNYKKEETIKVADRAVLIAGVVAIIFMVAGPYILAALSITLSDFRIAGGIVLVLLGIENTLNIHLNKNKKDEGLDSAAVLIATPLLTGPGLMTSLVILNKENGITPVIIALIVSLILSLIIFRNATKVRNLLGPRIIMIFSKVMGLFLIAIGIAFIRSGMLGG